MQHHVCIKDILTHLSQYRNFMLLTLKRRGGGRGGGGHTIRQVQSYAISHRVGYVCVMAAQWEHCPLPDTACRSVSRPQSGSSSTPSLVDVGLHNPLPVESAWAP